MKLLTFFCLCLGTTAHAAVLVKQEHNIQEYKLENGLHIVLAPNVKANKVVMNTVYFTGALNDPQRKSGLAHLLEHLAFKGTTHLKGEEFQHQLDQYTLMNNASTDYYSTQYLNVIRPDQKAIDQMIYLEAERMHNLVLQKKFIPSEIEIVRREREMRLDQPFALLMDQVFKSAYGNQSLGRLPIGDLKDLKSIQLKEVEHFYQTWYAPNNATVVITGKFDSQKTLEKIEQEFKSISAKTLPAQAVVPTLNVAKIKNRTFTIQKGSDYARFNLYMQGTDSSLQPMLQIAPYLYGLEPSGSLYKTLVQTGEVTGVLANTWSEKDFNVLFLGAVYAPSQDNNKVNQQLTQAIETQAKFQEDDLKRAKSLSKNNMQTVLNNESSLNSTLSDYVVANKGQWVDYFSDEEKIQTLSINQLNQSIEKFANSQHRLSGNILPTPESEKKAQKQKKIIQQAHVEETPNEPVKDISTYQHEVQYYLDHIDTLTNKIQNELKIGKLGNGIQYALYPKATPDNKTYATVTLQFGTAESLKDKNAILDMMSYLLLRGTTQQNLQQITDKSIEMDGGAVASMDTNGIKIQIQANSAHFLDYFNYVLNLIEQPDFDEKEFNLLKQQTLANLDRPYTDPSIVANLVINRQLEQYQVGDFRYHFEPKDAVKAYQAVTRQQIKDSYQTFFKLNHAQIAVTGEFEPNQVLELLDRQAFPIQNAVLYHPVQNDFKRYDARYTHALAEQREFGNYIGSLTLPVNLYDQDAVALYVFEYVLGDSQLSSRLGQNLREKNHLVYGFDSTVDLAKYGNASSLVIQANYTPGKAPQVSDTVKKTLNDLVKNGITLQELESAKANLLKKRATALDDSRAVHSILNSQLETQHDMAETQKRTAMLAKLTKSQVDEVIRKYIDINQYVEVSADQFGTAQ